MNWNNETFLILAQNNFNRRKAEAMLDWAKSENLDGMNVFYQISEHETKHFGKKECRFRKALAHALIGMANKLYPQEIKGSTVGYVR